MKTDESNSYLHILKYTGLFGGTQGLTILVGLLRTKLVAVILGPSGMGLMSLFNSVVNLISNITNFGLSTSGVKHLSEVNTSDKECMKQRVVVIRHWELLAAIMGIIVCLLLSPFINKFTFTWGDHTLHFAVLSFVVGMLAITGGETAIMKATGKLRQLALIAVWNVVFALITSIPLYFFYGMSGIVPSLLVIALLQMILTLRVTLRIFPISFHFSKQHLLDGLPMMKMGMAFIAANFFTYGIDFLVKRFLNTSASLDEVGLYNTAFMISTAYAGIIFSSLETDYFPRLSLVNKYCTASNITVNRQIEVTFLLSVPMLTVFMVVAPLIIPILFTNSFASAVGMIQILMLSLIVRSVKTPIAYMTLAKGDSLAYLLLEAYSAILTVWLITNGYNLLGLNGAGWGYLVAEAVDVTVVLVYTYIRYHYRMTLNVLRYILYHIPVIILAFLCTQFLTEWTYWLFGFIWAVASIIISVNILRRKTKLWEKLKKYFIMVTIGKK